MGYHRAGFEVVGVDIEPQPNYPFEFIQGDALDWASWHVEAAEFDAIHASPPCPRFSLVSGFHGVAEKHPDLLGPVRAQLDRAPTPYVIENVPGAPMRRDVVLCGEMFGLRVHRHRWFECRGVFVMAQPHTRHRLKGAATNCEQGDGIARWITGNYANYEDAADAMGVDWPMARRELANAIPPAYTEHIGGYLMAEINAKAA